MEATSRERAKSQGLPLIGVFVECLLSRAQLPRSGTAHSPRLLKEAVMLTYVCPDTGWKPWGHRASFWGLGFGVHPPLVHKHIACKWTRVEQRRQFQFEAHSTSIPFSVLGIALCIRHSL